MKTISYNELAEKIKNLPGSFPVGILSETDARLKKTGNPHPNVTKISRSVGWVGASYQGAVRREGERQDANAEAFIALPRPWGQWMDGATNKVATNKGKFYLRTQSTPGQRMRQRAKVLAYRDETTGKLVNKETITPFMPAKSFSNRQAEVGIANAGEQVDVREFAFDSIRAIRIAGQTFAVVP